MRRRGSCLFIAVGESSWVCVINIGENVGRPAGPTRCCSCCTPGDKLPSTRWHNTRCKPRTNWPWSRRVVAGVAALPPLAEAASFACAEARFPPVGARRRCLVDGSAMLGSCGLPPASRGVWVPLKITAGSSARASTQSVNAIFTSAADVDSSPCQPHPHVTVSVWRWSAQHGCHSTCLQFEVRLKPLHLSALVVSNLSPSLDHLTLPLLCLHAKLLLVAAWEAR